VKTTNTFITVDALDLDARYGPGNHFTHTSVNGVDAWLIDDDSTSDLFVLISTGANPTSWDYSAQGGFVAGWFFFPTDSNFSTMAIFSLMAPNYIDAHFIFEESSGSVNIRTGGVVGSDPQVATNITVNKGEWVFLAYLHLTASYNREHRAYDTSGNVQTSTYSGTLRLAISNRTAATAFSNNENYLSGIGNSSTNQFYVNFFTTVYSTSTQTLAALRTQVQQLAVSEA